jgi:hypothetical protein
VAASPAASTASPSAVSSASTASTTAALCLGARFIHHEVPPTEILSVQGIDRALGVFVAVHFDEGETARLARESVADKIDAGRGNTNLREPFVELILRRGKRKITDIELLHLLTPSVRNLKCESRSALKRHLRSQGAENAGPPRERDRYFSGLLHPLGNWPLLQWKILLVPAGILWPAELPLERGLVLRFANSLLTGEL